jgi:hypothetical protein
MVQAIRDQWVIASAIVVVVGVVAWLLVDRWIAGGWRRGR